MTRINYEKLGAVLGVALMLSICWVGISLFTTFVVGLFVAFPVTLGNVFKVGLAILALRIAMSEVK